MRLVHGGRMEDCLHAAQTTPHARAVGYRADVSRKRRVNDVEADDLVFQAGISWRLTSESVASNVEHM